MTQNSTSQKKSILFSDNSYNQLMMNRYKPSKLLYIGNTHSLYLAMDLQTKTPVIVRIFPSLWYQHIQTIQPFTQNHHDCLLKIYEVGLWEHHGVAILEFAQGIVLQELCKNNPLSLPSMLKIILQMIQNIQYLQHQNIPHYNLSLEDMLWSPGKTIQFLNLGYHDRSQEEKKQHVRATIQDDMHNLGNMIYELILGEPITGYYDQQLLPLSLKHVVQNAWNASYPTLTELYDDVVLAQASPPPLFQPLSVSVPSWNKLDVQLAGTLQNGYWDFIQHDQAYQVLCIKTTAIAESEQLLLVLKGMIAALRSSLDHTAFITQLNTLLLELHYDVPVLFASLLLFPNESRFSFVSCGAAMIWHMPGNLGSLRKLETANIALGISSDLSPHEIEGNWFIEDTLALVPFLDQTHEIHYGSTLMTSLQNHQKLTGTPQIEAVIQDLEKKIGRAWYPFAIIRKIR